eukprot:5876655-Prymnesium_polylepis.1
MHDVHPPPPPHMQLAVRDATPLAPARPRVTMQGAAPDTPQLIAQPAAPPATRAPAAGAPVDAGVVGAIQHAVGTAVQNAVGTAVDERMRAVADAQRRERNSYADHLATLSRICNRVIKNSQTFPGELTHARNPP